MSSWFAPALAVPLALLASTDGPAGRWVGQDGHDLVGESPRAGPSEIQDLHFVLTGLPTRARIVGLVARGEGGGEWKLDGTPGSWLALVERNAGETSADVFIEPYQVETGRVFEFKLTFDDGRETTIYLKGGKANPHLRSEAARLTARWLGQGRDDQASASPNVGPDGLLDARIGLGKLSAIDPVGSVLVLGPGESRWQAGPNPEAFAGADLILDPADRTRGVLHFQPTRDLEGQSLKVIVRYAKGKVDTAAVIAGRFETARKADFIHPPDLGPIDPNPRWVGQGEDGLVLVAVDGLADPTGATLFALGDGSDGWWSDRPLDEMPGAARLGVRPGPRPGSVELRFPPVRDESDAAMTLRVGRADGRSAIATFPGGPADPGRVAAAPGPDSADARPGDDLNALAARGGSVRLAAGTYRLKAPLVLDRAIAIRSDGGTTLLFDQPAADPAWTAAIRIGAGRVTLDRLAVRFAGPVRWDRSTPHGPALIGTASARERPAGVHLSGLRFTRLDVEGPPIASAWEESPRLIRMSDATSGVIEGGALKGGTVEVWGGPWRIVGNRMIGTPARAFSHASLAVHDARDVVIAENRASQVDPAGKTWRWLVLTNRGSNVRVVANTVERIGPRDADRVEHPNAPETILTESYRLHFEGKPAGVSADGRVVALPDPQGGPPWPGSILAILSGPEAGQWRRIVLPVGADSYLLDRPIAPGGGAVSVAAGFVTTSFERNTIDDRGSRVAKPIVLAGHHFGTRLVANRTLGGGEAALIFASASESPRHWGWSHNPMFGLQILGNRFEGSAEGVRLAVEHGPLVRASRGRVYFTATLADNLFDAPPSSRVGQTAALRLGWMPSGDPGELVIDESGDRVGAGRSATPIEARMATLNGRAIREGRAGFAPGSRPTD